MKLLGWMHRKFRQHGSDASRDLATASACLYCLSGWASPDDHRFNPPPEILRQESLRAETEQPDLTASDIFDGLLTIGTFGSPIIFPEVVLPPANEEEETVDEMAEKEGEMTTESELIAFSVELEKVLAAESDKGMGMADRPSTASARPSHTGASGKVSDVCPLQDFLFGSPVEAAATTAVAERRRERRASLGELFMRSQAADDGSGARLKKEGVILEDEDRVRPAPYEMSVEMKKLFKCRESVSDGRAAAGKCRGTENKIQNILRIFHRKIHPENSTASKKFPKPAKYEINKENKSGRISKSSRKSASDHGRQVLSPEKDESFVRSKSHSCQDSRTIAKNNSTGIREQWIKTDADYLVLEL